MAEPEATAASSCKKNDASGPAPLRRLSRVEYGNTVFQLFGNPDDQRLGIDQLVPDGESLGFSNQAGVVSTSPLLASQYLENAADIAEAHVDDFDQDFSACRLSPTSRACKTALHDWLSAFGKRVYRRPLVEDDLEFYQSLYDWEVEARGEHREGLKLVLQALLQSPHFLYRPEFGAGRQDDSGGTLQLSSWEMASRLSYMFWGTMPDDALFDAAEADELRSAAQIEKQARRLLRAPRARLAFSTFHIEWLDLQEVLEVRHNGKDKSLFPDYEDGIPAELYAETLEFLDYAIFERNANLKELLTAPYTRWNRQTAEFYGVTDGPSGDEYETIDLDPTRYSGFLTQAGLLMAHATTELSSPVHRGLFVRTNLLCQPPPPPPPDVPPPPRVDRTKTTREQYAEHSDNPTCAACHQLMDPIGLGFENFDAMGRYREQEWGQELDASGEIYQVNESGDWGVEATFQGAAELGRALSQSRRVNECFARQWFRFAMGRGETAMDRCSLATIDERFASSDYDIKELLVAITQTPAFRSLPDPGEQR